MKKLLSSMRVEIVEACRAKLDHSWDYRNVNSPFSRLYHIEDGEGLALIRGSEIRMVANAFYLLPAYEAFDVSCDEFLVTLRSLQGGAFRLVERKLAERDWRARSRNGRKESPLAERITLRISW